MQFARSPFQTAAGHSIVVAALTVALALALAGCGDTQGDAGGGSAVTADQFRQIPTGVAEGEIRYELGEPAAERQEGGEDCLDYHESKGEGIARPRMFRFCFRDGTLVRKSAF
jgi:outer membrane protein assembly factor BamE (lipoprotein component of BamABCDE complex)